MSRAAKKLDAVDAFQLVIDAALAIVQFEFAEDADAADLWPKQVHDRISALNWRRMELRDALLTFSSASLPEPPK